MSQRPPTIEERREYVRLVARLGGCTCEPDITFHELGAGAMYAQVAHDGDCGHYSQVPARATARRTARA